MGKLITKSDGSPFATETAARSAVTRFKLKDFIIVPHNSGYAISVKEETQMEPSANVAPAMQVPPTITPEEAQKLPTSEIVKHRVTAPWRPARVLDIPEHLKNPAFTYRWCDKNKPGNIQKKMSEGWEIDKELSRKLTAIATRTVNDGTPLDGTAQIRELVVMKMPKEMAASRNEYYAKRSEMATKEAQEDLKRKTGGQAYGEIREERH